MNHITVLYDAGCPVCERIRSWMSSQPALVDIDFLPCAAPEARHRYGPVAELCRELVVVGDGGEAYVGPDAFLVCLWALSDYRDLAESLAEGVWAPLARWFFRQVSRRRGSLSLLVGGACDEQHCGPPQAFGPYR